jgi:hypothetical protein
LTRNIISVRHPTETHLRENRGGFCGPNYPNANGSGTAVFR